MNPTIKCGYCGTVYQIEHGHVCEVAERVMQAKRDACFAADIGSPRNARRLQLKLSRKKGRS